MDSIAEKIKERTVSRNVSLMALTALEEQDEIVLFTENDLLSLLQAVAEEQDALTLDGIELAEGSKIIHRKKVTDNLKQELS